MHICIIISTHIPAEEGIGNYAYNLSKKLTSCGHKVTILTRGGWEKTVKENIDSIDILKVRFIPLYPLYLRIHGHYVNKALESLEFPPDIVHIHSPLTPFIKTSLPIIITVHTPMLIDTRSIELKTLRSSLDKLMGKFVSYPLELKLLRRANLITTVSYSVADELKEYGLNPKDINVVGNGVDHKLFVPIYKNSNHKYILYTGRLAYRKGLFDLVECGKKICSKYSNVSFVIIGKGGLRRKLEKRVIELGLGDRFHFLGYVEKEDLIRLYQNAIMYIMPSHYEGLPTVLLEAMSCGLPVIATAVSGNLDVIINGKNGILIPPKNSKEMSNAISMLLDNDDLRKKLGEAARKTIEERFTWDIVSDKIVKCYQISLEKNR